MSDFIPDAKWTPEQATRVANMLNSHEDPRWLWAAHGSTVRGMDRDGHAYSVTADSNVVELDEGGAAHPETRAEVALNDGDGSLAHRPVPRERRRNRRRPR